MILEQLESKLRDRRPETVVEFQAKPPLLASATAEAQPTVPVGVVIMSVGGFLIICVMLVAFGAGIEHRRARYP